MSTRGVAIGADLRGRSAAGASDARTSRVVLELLGLLRGYRPAISASVCCALTYTLLSLVPPLLIRQVVRVLGTSGASRADPAAARSIAFLALGIAGVAVLRGICRYADAIISHVVAYRILHRLLVRVYTHLQRLPHRFYAGERTGALATRAVADVEAIEVFLAHAIAQAVQAFLIPLAMVAVLFAINARLAVFTLVPLPLVAWIALWWAPRFGRLWRRVRHQLAELGATFQEDASGITVVKAFARERERRAHLQAQSERFRDQIIQANVWTLVPASTIEAIGGVGAALVVWQGGLRGLTGGIATADLLVFILYGAYIYQPVLQLAALTDAIGNAVAAGERVFELLATEPDIVDAPGAIVPSRASADVRFERVTFGYAPARPVLRELTLDAPEGATVALVGPTGAGKTTAMGLIPRFYDVQGGAVLVGGYDVRDVALAWLRGRIALVPQDVFLFHGSIRENLLFGRPDATDRQVEAAARAANADEFILSMPDGYDTVIGERGVRLSGGQKQRIAIARALLKDAPILLLDEPTSSVDVETEALIQEALTRLCAGRTTVVIAHRLSTVRRADRIAVLDGGRVTELGTHDSLLRRGGLYAHLYHVQLDQQAWTLPGRLRTREGAPAPADVPPAT